MYTTCAYSQPSKVAIIFLHTVTCTFDQLTCPSGICLSSNRQCDGIYDCADYSDEQGCGKKYCFLYTVTLQSTASSTNASKLTNKGK